VTGETAQYGNIILKKGVTPMSGLAQVSRETMQECNTRAF